MPRPLFSRIAATFRRTRLEKEFDDEVGSHLDQLTERYIRNGMDPVEAAHAARRQFGGLEQVRQHNRDHSALPPLDILIQDFRHAARRLRKSYRFTLSAALTLALGIGATTAVFAVLDTVVLRPLPYKAPGQLAAFASIDRRGAQHESPLSYPTSFDFRAQNRVFEHLVSYRDSRFTLTDSQPPIQVVGQVVSWDLFPLLGVQPALGRGFRPEEERAGAHAVVLSDRLWHSRFGGDAAIVGHNIRINGRPFTVTGIAPPGFSFPVDMPDVDLWSSIGADASVSDSTPLTDQRGARLLDAIGRLKPGITFAAAQSQMDLIGAALARQYPDENGNVAKTLVKPELERLLGGNSEPLWILLGAVGLVLLIACANVANLLLARSTERTREFNVRAAIGASRGALVRQLMIESLTLGLAGSAAGILLAFVTLRLIVPLAGDRIPRIAQTSLDARTLLFAAFLAILTSVLFTIAPALRAVRGDLTQALKQGATNIAEGRHGFRSTLVIGQIALGLVLLAGAEMLIGGFAHLLSRDPGFRPDHLLTFEVGLPAAQYDDAAEVAFSRHLLERLRAIPGVHSAAAGFPLPLTGQQMSVSFDIEEHPALAPDRPHSAMAIVTPGFFTTLGIPLLEGRDFSERDEATTPRVLVVNDAFARKYFPGQNALGKRIRPGATNGSAEKEMMREIVGIVGNAKQVLLTSDPEPIYYFPFKQLTWDVGAFVLRAELPPNEVQNAARAAVSGLDRNVPTFRFKTGEEIAYAAIAQPRFLVTLMSAFAAIALLLTVAGIYGVLSYTVAVRRREIGLRIALGARREEVLGLILKEAMQLVVVGLILGVAGAAACARLIESHVYGTKPDNAATLAIACVLMLAAGVAAAWFPALRAVGVDPMHALRNE